MQGELAVVQEAVASLRVDGVQDSYRLNPAGWAKDVLGVHLWSKQREITASVRDHKRTVVASCHGSGKALALDTPLPTPTGWTTMREVEAGDELLGVDGRPAKVVATTPVWENEDTYEVVFSDGATITCSGKHEWNTLTAKVRNRIRVQCHREGREVDWRQWWHASETFTTEELLGTLRTAKWEHNHAVPQASTVSGTETAFMVEPRQMGLEPANTGRRVPIAMQRAANGQRWSFICGLADNCAFVDRTGAVIFSFEDRTDAHDVAELLRSSGLANVTRVHPDELHWHVVARMSENPFIEDVVAEAEFEQRNANKRTYSRNTMRTIVDVRRVATVPTRCVQVDAPHHLYLAGREMVPTHNSMIASVIAAWWVSVHPPGQAIVITTAPTSRQVSAILWEEIRKHHRTAAQRGLPLPGYVNQSNEWKLSDGTLVGMGRKPQDGDEHAFQGIHRPYVLVIVDEACGVPEELWTGVEAITTTANSRILAIGNPDDRQTTFGDVYLKDNYSTMWNRISIPASSTPNFTGEPVPMPLPDVLVQVDWVHEREKAWTKEDPRYQAKVEARFPEHGTMGLFGPQVLARGFDQEGLPRPDGKLIISVDPARFGDDRTAVVARRGRLMWVVDSWQGMDTTNSAHKVMNIADDMRGVDDKGKKAEFDVEIRVDAIGLGAGVLDTLAFERAKLEKQGAAWFDAIEMNGAAAPPLEQGGVTQSYGNARAYWYDKLKQGMANGSRRVVEHDVAREELEGTRLRYSSGKMYIEDKNEIRKRLGKSPDFADGLSMAAADIYDGLQDGDAVTETAEDIAAQELDEMLEALEMQISPF